MNDRLVTAAAAALLALGAVGLLVQPDPYQSISRPTTEDLGPGGYAALRRWLDEQGVDVVSHRKRYDELFDPDRLAPTGNLMIVSLPQRFRARVNESRDLADWVRRGNTLLVMAAINDAPEWSELGSSQNLWEGLSSLADLDADWLVGFEPSGEDGPLGDAEESSPSQEERLVIEVVPGHPLNDRVELLEGTPRGTISWELVAGEEELLLGLTEPKNVERYVWQKVSGAGQIIVMGSGSLFTNASIGRADNRIFLANLIRRHVDVDVGAVIFDDMHQGLSALYDAQALFADPRLHRTIAFVIGWWLIWVIGTSNRLRPPSVENVAPAQRDYLNAVGGFMARRLTASDTGRLMIERWYNEVCSGGGAPATDTPDWQELIAVPGLTREMVDPIQTIYRQACKGERIDVLALHNALGDMRRAIG